MRLFGWRRNAGHEEALQRHLEQWFGPGTTEGWPMAEAGITVLRYEGQPAPDLATLVTIGLSHRPLRSAHGAIREELIVTTRADHADGNLAFRLFQDAMLARQNRQAIVPDEIGSIGEAIRRRADIRTFWASRPHGFDEAFERVEGTGEPFWLVQLVPLIEGEHQHALEVGGHQFGHDIEGQWTELVDLGRESLYEPMAVPGGFHWAGLLDLAAEPDPDRVAGDAIARLRPGDLAKLVFLIEPIVNPGPAGERMWVEVTTSSGDRYVGRLENQPAYLVDLAVGDEIRFDRRHVLDVRPVRRR
jgi:hypothetical protein